MANRGAALITGASSGLGEELAVELGRRGWKLGLVARRADELERVARRVEGKRGQAIPLPGNVLDPQEMDGAVATLEERFGPVELLVANAGVGSSAKSHQRGGEAAEKIIRINVLGVIHAVDAVIEGMVERGRGQIVGVSSLAGWRGLPGSPAYSASKAAITTYLETLRVDLNRRGIHVTTIHPGFVKTPMTAKNKQPMPFLMEVEKAARIMADGIESRRREVNFPWQLSLLMRLVRNIPNPVYDLMAGRTKAIG